MEMHHYEPVACDKMLCYIQGQGHSVGSYYRLYCVFSTGDLFATKLSLMGHHHKPDCLVKNTADCFVQSQVHNDGAASHRIFVNPIFSVLLIFAIKIGVLMYYY